MTDTPTVTVQLPGLLSQFIGGRTQVAIEADTVQDTINALLKAYPTLQPHLVGDEEALRPHLLLVHNGTMVSGRGDAATPVEPGDEVVVLQAVSGG